jgi:glutamine synthetase
VGNGVHIHFSLLDRDGKPASYDASGPGGVSTIQGSFLAGVVRHARAICAITAPSVISYERLKPHSWSAHYTNLAERDREAMLRICPYPEGVDVARRFNIEFRAADAAASPYLQLGALVRAGLDGIRAQLPCPPLTTGDLSQLSAEERQTRGVGQLPGSLSEALVALESDETAMGWLGPVLGPAYLMHKRGEIAMANGIGLDELCQTYAKIY